MAASFVFIFALGCDPKANESESSEPLTSDDFSVEGSIEYASTAANGAVVCDRTIRFTGSSFTGECPECDFAFRVDAEVTADRGESDCEMVWQLSLIPESENWSDLWLGFAAAYEGIATNVLFAGATRQYEMGWDTGGYGSEPYMYSDSTPIAFQFTDEYQAYRDEYNDAYADYYEYYGMYSAYPTGTATFASNVLSWSTSWSYVYMDSWFWGMYHDDCEGSYGYGYGEAVADHATGFVDEGTLPCDEDYGYAWISQTRSAMLGHQTLIWGHEPPGESSTEHTIQASTHAQRADGAVAMEGWFDSLKRKAMRWLYDEDEDSGDTGWASEEGDTGFWGDASRTSELLDVWTMDLAAGDEVLVTIDSPDADHSFVPLVGVSGPDSCPLGLAVGGLPCSGGTAADLCSGINFVAESDGSYQVIVATYTCVDSEFSSYRIGVDSPSDPNLSLIEDDVQMMEIKAHEHTAVGTATLTR
jgi:hypothetical protein